MDHFQRLFIFQPALTFILAFMAITFLQSGLDKILDWKGNVSWITAHFSKSCVAPFTTQIFLVLTITEVVAGVLSAWALVNLAFNVGSNMALCALEACATALLMLFLGQRVAKDYAGASVIAIYFAVCVLGIHLATRSGG